MATKRAGLGRGLEALIPSAAESVGSESFQILPVESVSPNPDQPRTHFDDEGLEELAASIREVGVLQPVLVTATPSGFQLIAGERRWRAARRAGLKEIPALVRQTEGSTLAEALIENLQRQDLTPIEEASAYRELTDGHGLTQEAIAERVGKSRPSVANALRLLTLPEQVRQMVDDGTLSAGHARALVGLDDSKYAIHLARRAADGGWSVRQLEEAVKLRRGQIAPRSGRVTEIRPVEIIELERRLADRFGTKVKINYRKEKGKVEISFKSLSELERLYRSFIG